MKNNLELWERVQKTDPKHTKKAKIGGMSITAVAPQYQILNATREFGVYGQTWGFKNIDFDFTLVEKFKLVVLKATFFSPEGECQIVNSSKIYMDRAETMVDADFAKKMETDALTKVLSKMGFNADIFMGRFDDVKYVNEMKAEFKEKPSLDDSKLDGCDKWSDEQKEAVKNKFKLTKKQLELLK
tara:strand:- start:1297 stop:1851 length:555 start_codon:yes stop_codon:yes gene_type:complete